MHRTGYLKNASRYVIGFIFCLVIFVMPGVAGAQSLSVAGEPTAEEVTSFASDITVREDGRITVVEKIEYFFPEPRHGIYRDIPTRYELDDGRTLVVPVKVKSVTGAPYEVTENRYAVRIKIGDPDRTVTGLQSYEITYEASGAIRYFADHDELYWNVTGSEWEVPLRRVSAIVHLPDAVNESDITLRCFMGPAGSSEYECLYQRSGKSAHFAADDFLTVVVGWNPGVVARLEAREAGFYSDYVLPALPVLPVAIAIPVIVFIILLRRWMRIGRDPEGSGTLVAQYEPPDRLTPAEIGVLIDEKAQMKDVSATIVDLAVRGYIKINDEKSGFLSFRKNFGFRLLKPDFRNDPELKHFEVKILSVMFVGLDYVTLENLTNTHAFHTHLSAINKSLYEQTVAGGYFAASPESVRMKYFGIGAATLVIAGVAIFMFGGLVTQFINVTMFIALVASVAVTGVIFLIFASAMPRKTEQGVAAWDHARGFKEYLKTAEKYRLEWQEKEKIFERFLPYAMVFGVVREWSEAFKNLDMKPPDWYEGEAIVSGRFHVGRFMASMGALETGFGKALTSAPSKSSSGSGFGGGGHSGGGFGGGGGGSW